jgi:hypothetical protein
MMPKRVIDFDAMWASDKLAACAEWAQAEYAWFYGLADASGSFELTNLRVIWGRVAAIRRNLTIERLEQVLDEFIVRGLLFTWEENGKRYGHWTGSDVPGRLPSPSWRARLERLAPPVPRAALAAYVSRYGGRHATPASARSAAVNDAMAGCVPVDPVPQDRAKLEAAHDAPMLAPMQPGVQAWDEKNVQLTLKLGLEAPQAQDWVLDLERNREKTQERASAPATCKTAMNAPEAEAAPSPEQMLEVYDAERGALPAAERLTPERRRQCTLRLAAGLSLAEFRAAVRRTAATPFLAGGGERGWRANFDWLIANETNIRKVLEGRYDPPGSAASQIQSIDIAGAATPATVTGPLFPTIPAGEIFPSPIAAPINRRAAAELYVGAGPVASVCGARVKPTTLERIRARDATGAQEVVPENDQERRKPLREGVA